MSYEVGLGGQGKDSQASWLAAGALQQPDFVLRWAWKSLSVVTITNVQSECMYRMAHRDGQNCSYARGRVEGVDNSARAPGSSGQVA